MRTLRLTSRVVAVATSTALVMPALVLASPIQAAPLVGLPWGPNGFVNAVAAGDGGAVYVGGDFTAWGRQSGGLVAVRPDTGEVSTTAPMPWVEGYVFAIEPDGAGGYFLGGLFDGVGGLDRENLAHVDAAGEVTDWAPRTTALYSDDAGVYALALHGSTLFVGGEFEEVSDNGGDSWVERFLLASFDASTGELDDWDPGLNPGQGDYFDDFPSRVSTMAIGPNGDVDGDVLYVGGEFGSVGDGGYEVVRRGAAAFAAEDFGPQSAEQGDLLSWDPGPNGPVFDILVRDSGVVLGGVFDEIDGGSAVMSLAEVGAAGELNEGALTTFEANVERDPVTLGGPIRPGQVFALASSGTDLLIGGLFDYVNTALRTNLAAVPANATSSTQPLLWVPAPDDLVSDIAVAGDGAVTVTGDFSEIGGTPVERRGSARFSNLASDAPLPWDPGLSDNAEVVVDAGSVVLLGGEFEVANSMSVPNHLVRLLPDGSPDEDFIVDLVGGSARVDALAYYEGSLFASFTENYDSTVFLLDGATGDEGIGPVAEPNGIVNSLAIANPGTGDHALIAAGDFTSVVTSVNVTSSRTNAFALDLYTLQMQPWAPALPGYVTDLYVDDEWVYVVGGGPLSGAYLGPAPYALRAPADTTGNGALDTWAPDFSVGGTAEYGEALAITKWRGEIVVGGSMLESTSGQDDGSALLGVSPSTAAIAWRSGVEGRNAVRDLVVDSARLYVAGRGEFSLPGSSQPHDDITAWSAPDTELTWAAGTSSGSIDRLVVLGDRVVAAGTFDESTGTLASSPRARLAYFPLPTDGGGGSGGGGSGGGGSGGGGSGGGGSSGGGSSAPASIVDPGTSPGVTGPPGPDTSVRLRPGEVAMLVNGARVPVMARAEAGNTALVVLGAGATVTIPSPGGLGSGGAPRWAPGQRVSLTASDLRAGTSSTAYLLSTPVQIGAGTVSAGGALTIASQIPRALEAGGHTLQLVMVDREGRPLLLAVGVQAGSTRAARGTRVYFDLGKARVTSAGRAAIGGLVSQVRSQSWPAPVAVVTGVVRASGADAADRALARQRAQAVARELRSSGFTGSVRVQVARQPSSGTWTDRRVQVEVSDPG